jgi:hypothetical protein
MFTTMRGGLSAMLLTLTLSACVTTPPQPAPDSSTRVSAPVADTAGPRPAAPDKSALNRKGGKPPGGLPDWTRLFKTWENGCENSPEFDAFETQFAALDKVDQLKWEKVNLPPLYKSALGTPASRNRGDYANYTFPVTAGSYYGLPVKAIQLYRGHTSGIAGKQLLLHASEQDVRQTLKKQKVSFKKQNGRQAEVVGGDTRETWLTCDHSD